MKREQFTFYRSYYDALNDLPERERAKVLFALLAYALDEEEPNGLTGICSACFKLIRPTLDSGRNKSANRKNKTKTNEEQTDNKPKTKDEQNSKEKEVEREVECEKEKERELESEYDSTPNPYGLTDDELRRVRQEQSDAETAARRVGLPVSAAADFDSMDKLREEHGAANLIRAIDRLQGANEKSRNWRYVGGILRKEKARGYTWADKPPENAPPGGGQMIKHNYTTSDFAGMVVNLDEEDGGLC